MNRIIGGLLAGTAATVPMTVVMLVLHRWPTREREALPPELITQCLTEQIGEQIGDEHPLDKSQLRMLTLANHFGFGAAMGGIYAQFAPVIPANPALKGAVWGLIVWAMSYLGWLPATHILEPATQSSRRRNFLMIIAHLIWGVCTAFGVEKATSKPSS